MPVIFVYVNELIGLLSIRQPRPGLPSWVFHLFLEEKRRSGKRPSVYHMLKSIYGKSSNRRGVAGRCPFFFYLYGPTGPDTLNSFMGMSGDEEKIYVYINLRTVVEHRDMAI